MTFLDGCYSLKLECALRDLGFVDIGWKCIAHAGLFFVEPYALEERPQSDLLGFNLIQESKVVRMTSSAKKALDLAFMMS